LIIRSDRTRRCSAASEEKPRSRKTLPLDRVTFSFILNLPPCGIVSPSLHDQGSKPVSGDFQLSFRGFPGSLLEGVQHVDALLELRDIEDSMFEFGVDTNLPNTGSYSGHRFPVVRFKPLLDTPQLEPRNASCVGRKTFEIVSRRSEPKQRLVRHGLICKY